MWSHRLCILFSSSAQVGHEFMCSYQEMGRPAAHLVLITQPALRGNHNYRWQFDPAGAHHMQSSEPGWKQVVAVVVFVFFDIEVNLHISAEKAIYIYLQRNREDICWYVWNMWKECKAKWNKSFWGINMLAYKVFPCIFASSFLDEVSISAIMWPK